MRPSVPVQHLTHPTQPESEGDRGLEVEEVQNLVRATHRSSRSEVRSRQVSYPKLRRAPQPHPAARISRASLNASI